MSPKRVLLLGAETDAGREAAEALARADLHLALVSSTSEPQSAFAVQRLARKLGTLSQAIDSTNEAAVRVMVRQLSKDLGGLDAAVVFADQDHVVHLFEQYATREMRRSGGGVFIDGGTTSDVLSAVEGASV